MMFKRPALLALCLPWLSLPALAQVEKPPVCPFSAAELTQALGAPAAEGRPVLELPAAGRVMRECRYAVGGYTLVVKTTVHAKPAGAQEAVKRLGGKPVPVPRDPDGAVIQDVQGGDSEPVVHYARANFAVELRVQGPYSRDLATRATDLRDMRARLVALRRLP